MTKTAPRLFKNHRRKRRRASWVLALIAISLCLLNAPLARATEGGSADLATYRVGEAPEARGELPLNPYGFAARPCDYQSSFKAVHRDSVNNPEKAASLRMSIQDATGTVKTLFTPPVLTFQGGGQEEVYFLCANDKRMSPTEIAPGQAIPLSEGLRRVDVYQIDDYDEMIKRLLRGVQMVFLGTMEGHGHLINGIDQSEYTYTLVQNFLWLRLNHGILSDFEIAYPLLNQWFQGESQKEELIALANNLYARAEAAHQAWEVQPEIHGRTFPYYLGEYLHLPLSPAHVDLYRLALGARLGEYFSYQPGVSMAFVADGLSLYFEETAAKSLTIELSSSPSRTPAEGIATPLFLDCGDKQPMIPMIQEPLPAQFHFTLERASREPEPEPGKLLLKKSFEGLEAGVPEIADLAAKTVFQLSYLGALEASEAQAESAENSAELSRDSDNSPDRVLTPSPVLKSISWLAEQEAYGALFDLPIPGRYELREVTTGEGYQLLEAPIVISFTGFSELRYSEPTESRAAESQQAEDWPLLIQDVMNRKAPIPETTPPTTAALPPETTPTPTPAPTPAPTPQETRIIRYRENLPLPTAGLITVQTSKPPLPVTGERSQLLLILMLITTLVTLVLIRRQI